MAFADSKPVFKDRATAAGLQEEDMALLSTSGLDTLSKFAFASSYVPGSGDDSEFVKMSRMCWDVMHLYLNWHLFANFCMKHTPLLPKR